jgi:hypothetical protein
MPTTLDSSTMRTFARLLITDGRASGNDATILTRALESGETDRAGLDAARDEIEHSGLSDDKKRVALKKLEAFLDQKATGVDKEFYSAPPSLMRSLKWRGINSAAELLERGATPAQRVALAREMRTDEKQVRALVKQADLRRLEGVGGKLASVLLDQGIDSVPELASRNAQNLLEKLQAFEKSNDGYVTSFKVPELGDGTANEKALRFVEDLIDRAGQLDRVVTFGRPTSGLETLTNRQRAEMFYTEQLDQELYRGDPVQLLRDAGVDNPEAVYNSMRDDALGMLADELDYYDIDVDVDTLKQLGSYDALLDHVSDDEADMLGNGGASFDPDVYVFKDDTGKVVGATLAWVRILDGDHDYGETHIVDHIAGDVTGYVAWGYEIDTDYYID